MRPKHDVFVARARVSDTPCRKLPAAPHCRVGLLRVSPAGTAWAGRCIAGSGACLCERNEGKTSSARLLSKNPESMATHVYAYLRHVTHVSAHVRTRLTSSNTSYFIASSSAIACSLREHKLQGCSLLHKRCSTQKATCIAAGRLSCRLGQGGMPPCFADTTTSSSAVPRAVPVFLCAAAAFL